MPADPTVTTAPTADPAYASPPGAAPRPRRLKDWFGLVKVAASSWLSDYAPSMGAALSYYSVFSLAPLLLIVISIAGLVFGEEAVRGEVFGQLQSLLGADAAKAIEAILASVSDKPAEGIASTLIGLAVLGVGATTVFGELQDALDRIWRAPLRERSGGLWALLRARVLSFGMILGIAFLLMVSLVMGAAVSALGKWWSGAFAGWEVLAQTLNFVLGFALTTGVFAMIYKIMPRVRVEWHDVWLGATVTAMLFTIGRFLIGLYIGKSGVASTFGAAGSLIVVFVWVYYSAQIFLIGAEFTWVYAKTFGSMRALTAPSAAATPAEAAAEATADPAPLSKRPEGLPSDVVPAPATRRPPVPAPVPTGARAAHDAVPTSRIVGLGFAFTLLAGLVTRRVLPKLSRRW